jgi:hypothetical protein
MRKYDIPPFIFSFKNDTFEVFSFFFIKYGLIPASSSIFPELIFINLFAVILFNISCVLANRY